jgi:hypothetical protein
MKGPQWGAFGSALRVVGTLELSMLPSVALMRACVMLVGFPLLGSRKANEADEKLYRG